MKKIYANPKVCINCHLCKVYCITAHSNSKNIIKAYKKENLKDTARIMVEEKNPVSFGWQCRHCDDAKCIASCITGAMRKDLETGIVYYNATKCVGCLTCIIACTFGAIQIGPDGKPLKCDLCMGQTEPACVVNCPNQALQYEERKEKP